jgi:CheY-like chemotaxis protein
MWVRAGGGEALFLTASGESYKRTLGGNRKLTGAELLAALTMQLQWKVKAAVADQSAQSADLAWMPSVERRANAVRSLVRDARILWVDDNPSNNLYERTVLASFGVSTDLALSTDEALYMAARLRYDLILSDMRRGGNPVAGMDLLGAVLRRSVRTPVIFYVGDLNRRRERPAGAFAITNRPDELLHYVLDVLERRDAEAG